MATTIDFLVLKLVYVYVLDYLLCVLRVVLIFATSPLIGGRRGNIFFRTQTISSEIEDAHFFFVVSRGASSYCYNVINFYYPL